MNAYENGVIKYAIDFERYKNGQANEIISLFDKANLEISKYIRKTNGVYTKARYKEIAKLLKDVSAKLKENTDKNIDIDGVIDYELKKERKLLELAKPYIQKIKGGEVNFLYPSREQIKTSALFKPIDTKYGMTYQSYLDGIENGLYNTWDSAVRTGYLTGMSTNQIVHNVLGGLTPQEKLLSKGSIEWLRNSVYGNTRTALQSFANETMQRVYEENEDYFGDIAPDGQEYKYEYLATLDARTCLVCADSAHLYKELSDVPHVPQHRNCRCVVIPYFNIEGETRATTNGQRETTLTFDEWLREQDEKTQKEVLGKTRYELFKRGEPISQFVDDGRVLKLDELKQRLGNDLKYDVILEKSSYEKSFEMAKEMFPNENWKEVYKDVYVAESRIPRAKEKNKIQTYDKELDMLKIASDNNHVSFMIPEINKGKNVDSVMDGVLTELKKVDGGESAFSHRFREALKQGKNVYLRVTSDLSAKRAKEIIRGVLLDKQKHYFTFDGQIFCYLDKNSKFYTWNMKEFYY